MFSNRVRTPMSLVWVISVLIGMVGLWFLGTWFLSAPPLSASNMPLAALTFQSPIGNPQLVLDKTVNNDTPQPNNEIIYTLSYSTTQPGSQAFNVWLYDFLPAGVQFISASPPPASYKNGVLMFTAPSVAAHTAVVIVRARVLDGHEQLYNHALVVADGVTPTHASLLTSVTQSSDRLRLIKTGYTYVLVDNELVYVLRCENTSDITVNDVTVADVLPTGLPLIDASPAPDVVTLPLLQWSLGQLGPGEIRTIVVTTTSPTFAGVITNTALADARQSVMTQTVFSTQVITEGAILWVTKEGSAPVVSVGDELVYTLQYKNMGNTTATGVVLTDTFPSGISVDGVYPPAASLTDQQGVWNLAALPPSATGEIVITTTVGGGSARTLHNVVNITGPDSFPGHAELDTQVRYILLYLPLVMRNS
ncbi:MAG: DUF11 domain-containing protein [Anaerolineae bacterium]|nr:DUF11 domain-containing protein [Anaerolineae bacterium]